jgi:hypothetical protein
MSTTRLPLPLELTKPVLLAGDLDTQFGGEYDPKTQLCSCTSSEQQCGSANSSGVQVDVTVDVQVDDVIA